MVHSPARSFGALLPALGLALFGCKDTVRSDECSKAIDAINAHVQEIRIAHTDDTAKDMAAYAQKLAEYDARLAEIQLTDPELARLFAAYQSMVRTLRDTAEAFGKKAVDLDDASARDFEARFKDLEVAEDAHIQQINAYCRRE